MVEPDVLDEIRKSGVPTCNFSCNNAHQFELVDELSPHFDYNLHSEKDAREKFLAIGATPLWWPMASNPKYFKPFDLPRTIAASFVGANYARRPHYLLSLLENNIDAHAYGPGWQWGSPYVGDHRRVAGSIGSWRCGLAHHAGNIAVRPIWPIMTCAAVWGCVIPTTCIHRFQMTS